MQSKTTQQTSLIDYIKRPSQGINSKNDSTNPTKKQSSEGLNKKSKSDISAKDDNSVNSDSQSQLLAQSNRSISNSDKTQTIHYNVQFYRNQRESSPSGDLISKIHKKWWGDYKLLERHHGYIQWLFPNSYTSRFNPQSHALSKQEQKIFRSDIDILKKYLQSYEMILEFFGMKLKSKITGEITQQRKINFRLRYHETLLTSFHNHMRITRILCSLTMVGFGRYAKELSRFLHGEIRTEKGNLRVLARYNIDRDWKVYEDYVETEEDLNVYLKDVDRRAKHMKRYEEGMKEKFGPDVEKSENDNNIEGKGEYVKGQGQKAEKRQEKVQNLKATEKENSKEKNLVEKIQKLQDLDIDSSKKRSKL